MNESSPLQQPLDKNKDIKKTSQAESPSKNSNEEQIDVKKQKQNDYEKICERTLQMDRWSSRLFDFSIILFLTFLYMVFVYIISPSSSKSPTEDVAIIQFSLGFIFYLGLFSLFSSFILMFLSGFNNVRFRKFNDNLMVKMFFYELSEKPEAKRRNELLCYISYTIWRIKRRYTTKGYFVTKPFSSRVYLDFRSNEDKLKVAIIDKTLTLVVDSLLYWETQDIKNLYRTTGDLFEKGNYLGLFKIVENNKKLFTDFDKLKDEMQNKAMKNKLKLIGGWFVKHSRDLIYALFILTLLMSLLGIIQGPIHIGL